MPKHCKYRSRMVRTRYDKCCLQLQVNTSKTVIICNLLPNILALVSGVFIPLVICAFSDVFNINSTYFRYSFALTCSLASARSKGNCSLFNHLFAASQRRTQGRQTLIHHHCHHHLRNLFKFMKFLKSIKQKSNPASKCKSKYQERK